MGDEMFNDEQLAYAKDQASLNDRLRAAVKEFDAAETAWEAWVDDPPIPCSEDGEVCAACEASKPLLRRRVDAEAALRRLAKEIG